MATAYSTGAGFRRGTGAEVDRAVMELLCGQYRGLLTVADIEGELDADPAAVRDSLVWLHRIGLIHWLDDYVFPTTSALRAGAPARRRSS